MRNKAYLELGQQAFKLLDNSNGKHLSAVRKIANLKHPDTNTRIGNNVALQAYLRYLEDTTPYIEEKYRYNVDLYTNKIHIKYNKIKEKIMNM